MFSRFFSFLWAVGFTVGLGASAFAQGTIDNFDSQSWIYWFGNVVNVGSHPTDGDPLVYSTEVSRSGQALLYQASWKNPGGVSSVRAARSDLIVPIPKSSITTDFSVDVFLRGGDPGADPVALKVELGTTGGNAFSAEERMTLNDWKTFTIPAGDIPGDITDIRFIFIMDFQFGAGNSSGLWDIFIDDIKIDGVVVDGMEREPETGALTSASVLTNGIQAAGPTPGGALSSVAAPAPNQGPMAYFLQWSGDTDGDVGITDNLGVPLNLTNTTEFSVDVLVPSGTTLPRIDIGASDGVTTATFTGAGVSQNDVWETVTIPVGAFGSTDKRVIDAVNVVAAGAGASGTVLFDNLRASNVVETTLDDYDSHDWVYWFGNVVNGDFGDHRTDNQPLVFTDEVSRSGQAALYQASWNGQGSISAVRAARSDLIAPIPQSAIATDFTVDVFLRGGEPGADLVDFKLELGTTAGNAVSSEEDLVLDGWKTFTVNAADIMGDITDIRYIFILDAPQGAGNSLGLWDIFIDDIKIDGVVFDGMERTVPTGVLTSVTAGPAADPADPFPVTDGTDPLTAVTAGGSFLSPAGPQPNEGDFAQLLQWDGDADGVVGFIENFGANGAFGANAVTLSDTDTLLIDVFVPAGQPLPRVDIQGTEDGTTAATFTGAAVTANGAWETIEIPVTANGDFSQLAVIADGAGATGRLFFDNLRVESLPLPNAAEHWAEY